MTDAEMRWHEAATGVLCDLLMRRPISQDARVMLDAVLRERLQDLRDEHESDFHLTLHDISADCLNAMLLDAGRDADSASLREALADFQRDHRTPEQAR